MSRGRCVTVSALCLAAMLGGCTTIDGQSHYDRYTGGSPSLVQGNVHDWVEEIEELDNKIAYHRGELEVASMRREQLVARVKAYYDNPDEGRAETAHQLVRGRSAAEIAYSRTTPSRAAKSDGPAPARRPSAASVNPARSRGSAGGVGHSEANSRLRAQDVPMLASREDGGLGAIRGRSAGDIVAQRAQRYRRHAAADGPRGERQPAGARDTSSGVATQEQNVRPVGFEPAGQSLLTREQLLKAIQANAEPADPLPARDRAESPEPEKRFDVVFRVHDRHEMYALDRYLGAREIRDRMASSRNGRFFVYVGSYTERDQAEARVRFIKERTGREPRIVARTVAG